MMSLLQDNLSFGVCFSKIYASFGLLHFSAYFDEIVNGIFHITQRKREQTSSVLKMLIVKVFRKALDKSSFEVHSKPPTKISQELLVKVIFEWIPTEVIERKISVLQHNTMYICRSAYVTLLCASL